MVDATLSLKIFRRERAITEFDWPFTPRPSSSKLFSTNTGSELHLVLPRFHPAHTYIIALRVYSQRLWRPYQTRFRYGYANCFTLPLRVTSRLIMQKARGRAFRIAPA